MAKLTKSEQERAEKAAENEAVISAIQTERLFRENRLLQMIGTKVRVLDIPTGDTIEARFIGISYDEKNGILVGEFQNKVSGKFGLPLYRIEIIWFNFRRTYEA